MFVVTVDDDRGVAPCRETQEFMDEFAAWALAIDVVRRLRQHPRCHRAVWDYWIEPNGSLLEGITVTITSPGSEPSFVRIGVAEVDDPEPFEDLRDRDL